MEKAKYMKPFSLYDDDGYRTTTGISSKYIDDSPESESNMVEVDMSEPNTLFSMSSKVRDALRDKPDDYDLIVYLVCGKIPSVDAGLFADYLKDVVQPIRIAFRGIVHFEFVNLFLNKTIHVHSQTQIMYSKEKLHYAMKSFLTRPEAFKKFMQRFVDEYWKLNEGNMLQISELESLGIKTEIL